MLKIGHTKYQWRKGMTIVLEPIRPKKISEEIVNQIKQLISSGELKPGDRIPSERELAAAILPKS